MTFADRLNLAIEDAVNAGHGRNSVSRDQVAAMAGRLGYHRVRAFTDQGEKFLAFMFPADESELVISAVNHLWD